MVKNTCCFSRWPKFSSQYPCQCLTTACNSNFRGTKILNPFPLEALITLLLCFMVTCCGGDSGGNTILFYSLCRSGEQERNKQKKQICGWKWFLDREGVLHQPGLEGIWAKWKMVQKFPSLKWLRRILNGAKTWAGLERKSRWSNKRSLVHFSKYYTCYIPDPW